MGHGTSITQHSIETVSTGLIQPSCHNSKREFYCRTLVPRHHITLHYIPSIPLYSFGGGRSDISLQEICVVSAYVDEKQHCSRMFVVEGGNLLIMFESLVLVTVCRSWVRVVDLIWALLLLLL